MGSSELLFDENISTAILFAHPLMLVLSLHFSQYVSFPDFKYCLVLQYSMLDFKIIKFLLF
jgi:hypothetical protein